MFEVHTIFWYDFNIIDDMESHIIGVYITYNGVLKCKHVTKRWDDITNVPTREITTRFDDIDQDVNRELSQVFYEAVKQSI